VFEETKKPATMMDFHNVLNKRKKTIYLIDNILNVIV